MLTCQGCTDLGTVEHSMETQAAVSMKTDNVQFVECFCTMSVQS